MDYRSAGVDVEAGRAFVERIRRSVEATHRPEVLGGLGGFAGLCRLPAGLQRPLLVAGTDGVGTKLELAQDLGRHRGIGIDLVAMCVNDVVTTGAEPLLFLDYVATGRLSAAVLAEVVEGIAEGCARSGCALLGGETAEMPGFYPQGRYDLAGFCLGVVEEERLIDGRGIRAGHVLVGIASSGVHSNGFSLVRSILRTREIAPALPCPALGGATPADALLEPTLLYGELVQALIAAGQPPLGMAHITGGGLPENLPRCLPEGLAGQVDPDSWERPVLFRWLQEQGEIPEADLWHTFNLGVGLVLVVTSEALEATLEVVQKAGFRGWRLGEVIEGPRHVLGLPGGS